MNNTSSNHNEDLEKSTEPISNQDVSSSEESATPWDPVISREEPNELEQAKAEADKFRDLYLRSQADLDNYRKRANREKEEAIRYANSALLERLLPVFDNFELGLEAARQAVDPANIVQGMSMVQRQFLDFLKDHHVEPIETQGLPFDHNFHEAVGQDTSDEVPEEHILRQIRRGYRMRDRLLRPASVIVSKGPGSSAAE